MATYTPDDIGRIAATHTMFPEDTSQTWHTLVFEPVPSEPASTTLAGAAQQPTEVRRSGFGWLPIVACLTTAIGCALMAIPFIARNKAADQPLYRFTTTPPAVPLPTEFARPVMPLEAPFIPAVEPRTAALPSAPALNSTPNRAGASTASVDVAIPLPPLRSLDVLPALPPPSPSSISVDRKEAPIDAAGKKPAVASIPAVVDTAVRPASTSDERATAAIPAPPSAEPAAPIENKPAGQPALVRHAAPPAPAKPAPKRASPQAASNVAPVAKDGDQVRSFFFGHGQ